MGVAEVGSGLYLIALGVSHTAIVPAGVILDEYNVADVCSVIFEDLIDQGKITQN